MVIICSRCGDEFDNAAAFVQHLQEERPAALRQLVQGLARIAGLADLSDPPALAPCEPFHAQPARNGQAQGANAGRPEVVFALPHAARPTTIIPQEPAR